MEDTPEQLGFKYMQTEIISNFLSGENISKDLFYAHINFDKVSSSFVQNNVYKDEIQFGQDASGEFLFKEYNPALFSSCYKYSNYSGSGIFDGSNSLYLNKKITNENITIFLHQNNAINPTSLSGKSKIFIDICSSSGSQNTFSYSVGLTDKNDIIIEFFGNRSGITEYKKTFLNNTVPDKTVLALQIKNESFNIHRFDINANIFSSSSLQIKDYNDISKDIYFGNKNNFIKNYHTGFSGVLNDLVIFDQILDENQLLDLSRLVAATGSFYSGVNLYSNPYKLYYSGKMNPTGILATGIIRYDRVLSEIYDLGCAGNSSCKVYVLSGVTGLITGNKIEYALQEDIPQNTISGRFYPIYNTDIMNIYSDFDIKNILKPNDLYEIQTYSETLNKTISSGFSLKTLPNNSDQIFHDGKLFRNFISGQNDYLISGAINNLGLKVKNTQDQILDGEYIASGLYNYTLLSGPPFFIPIFSDKKALYTSPGTNNFIRWTDNSGWTFVKNNAPIYGSTQNTSSPNQISNWFAYSNYLGAPTIELKINSICWIKNPLNRTLTFSGYSINSMIEAPNIDLNNFVKYNVYLDGIKLIENRDYYKSNNSIKFINSISNKELFITEDLYLNRITGNINNINIDSKIYNDKHLLWINGLLKIDGIDYGTTKYSLNGGFYNNVRQQNIQILLR
jgi:hypothetical protein